MAFTYRDAETSADTLKNAKRDALNLARTLNDALGKAKSLADPDLSAQGLQAKQDAAAATIRAAARPDLEALQKRLLRAKELVEKEAAGLLRIPDDAAALIRAEGRWRQIERRLDAGADLRSLISTADRDTLLAIAEYAPSWVTAQAMTSKTSEGVYGPIADWLGRESSDPAAGIRRAVTSRAAELSSTLEERIILRAAASAGDHVAAAQPWLEATESLVVNGTADMVTAAVASQMAEQSGAANATQAA